MTTRERLTLTFRRLAGSALEAVAPAPAVRRVLHLEGDRLVAGEHALPLAPTARLWVVALGKSAIWMAREAIDTLGPRVTAGVVASPLPPPPGGPRDGPASVRHFSGGHPLPDEGSLAAGAAALEMLAAAAPGDVVLVLVSGGGSALFEALLPGVTLAELRGATDALMRAGADIVELNTVRRALSRVKAGGLARAAGPAHVVSLILSDVVGDRLASIASGPTIDEPASPAAARAVLERRGLAAGFPGLVAALAAAPEPVPAPAGGGERIAVLVGSNRIAGEALCEAARGLGYQALYLTDHLQGEARDVGHLVGSIARGMAESGLPFPAPACLVLGGETTVTVRGAGRGGRNLELALGAALALEGCPDVALLSFATDGNDGSSGAAGAFVTGETIAEARALGLSPGQALADNDTAAFFEAVGGAWVTGRSETNVNDLVVALAYPPSGPPLR